jgi:methyltransferase (TIGR00027 family)
MASDSPEKESLASTAYWIATARAHETERVDRLFDDPWAALLAGQAGQGWLDRIATIQTQLDRISTDYRVSLHWGKPGQEWGYPALRFETAMPEKLADALAYQEETPTELGIVIRTKFFDDFLLQATREYHIPQIVILASGMDTRAFRLMWPAHTRFFEIDQPEVLLHKRQVLASVGASSNCWHRSIGADLIAGRWSATLLRTGFDPHQTSVWLIEGLLPYLPESVVSHLFDKVTALSAPGSWLGFTAVNGDALTSPMMRFWLKSIEEAGVPWLSAMDEPEALLAKYRWSTTVTQLGEESANFGRWPYLVVPRSVPNFPRGWLVTAIKQSSVKTSSPRKTRSKKLSSKNPHNQP